LYDLASEKGLLRIQVHDFYKPIISSSPNRKTPT
jgi:hypothetical protein